MRIERERDFARQLCREFKIPFPQAHVARNRLEAEAFLARRPAAVRHQEPALLAHQPDPHDPVRDGGGHALLAAGTSIMRKGFSCRNTWAGARRATSRWSAAARSIRWSPTRNTSAPSPATWASSPARRWAGWSSGIPEDKYGLARELIHPLLPWLREVKFHGPIQVTAVHRGDQWHVIEYNIRIGVTSGPMILRMLANPVETLLRDRAEPEADARNSVRGPRVRLLAHAGGLRLSVRAGRRAASAGGGQRASSTCDVWWNEVTRDRGRRADGHRPSHRRRDRASARSLKQADRASLREHPQDPQPRQLLPAGHRPEPLAAGEH